ncbi:hypothetical protein T484DRAFT_1961621, partial [Baffinella frigidus]
MMDYAGSMARVGPPAPPPQPPVPIWLVSTLFSLVLIASQVLPVLDVQRSVGGAVSSDYAIGSFWGWVWWLLTNGEVLLGVLIGLVLGLWGYLRVLLVVATASPRAVLLTPEQRKSRLSLLRDLGSVTFFFPAALFTVVATVRMAEPEPTGGSEWLHVSLLTGGTLAFIAAVLGQWVGTLLTIFVTNNFKVGISALSREACYDAGKDSDDAQEHRERVKRNVLFSLWIVGTNTALFAAMFLPAAYVSFYQPGDSTAAAGGFPLSIADAVGYAWRTGHLRGIGEGISPDGWGNKPLAVLGAVCIEAIPVLTAAGVTGVWLFGEAMGDERRWRWSCYIMELSGCSCFGMWQLALLSACFLSESAPPGVGGGGDMDFRMPHVEPLPGLFLGIAAGFSLWVLSHRVLGEDKRLAGQRWDADLSGYYIATPRPALEASRDQLWAEQRPLMVSSTGRGAETPAMSVSAKKVDTAKTR